MSAGLAPRRKDPLPPADPHCITTMDLCNGVRARETRHRLIAPAKAAADSQTARVGVLTF